MRRRLILMVVALLLLGGAGALAWTLVGWPPPRLVLKYGIPPYCAPTGKTMKVEGIEFVEIGPGCFLMGSHYLCEEGDLLGRLSAIAGLDCGTQPRHDSDECPAHWVEFPRGFWIGATEVTNQEYERYFWDHERSENSPGDRHPVVNVSWGGAKDWCAWLAKRSGRDVRLPSEAAWEAACRGGSETVYCYGDDEARLGEFAWYDENSKMVAHEVGTRLANGWGLFDLHGNVWEWCEDAYHLSYQDAPNDGSAWTEGGEEADDGTPFRVYRGGGWLAAEEKCRSACKRGDLPGTLLENVGFRPCIWPSEEE